MGAEIEGNANPRFHLSSRLFRWSPSAAWSRAASLGSVEDRAACWACRGTAPLPAGARCPGARSSDGTSGPALVWTKKRKPTTTPRMRRRGGRARQSGRCVKAGSSDAQSGSRLSPTSREISPYRSTHQAPPAHRPLKHCDIARFIRLEISRDGRVLSHPPLLLDEISRDLLSVAIRPLKQREDPALIPR